MTMRVLRSVRLTLGVGVLVLAGCGEVASPGTATVDGSWTVTAQSPVAPRHDPLVVAVGGLGLVLGGSDSQPCPPGASCVGPDRPALRDGATYDPARDTWRLITDGPVPIEGLIEGQAAVVGDTVYLLVASRQNSDEYAFVSYDVSDDHWERLIAPPLATYSALAAAGDRVIAYASTHEYFADPTGTVGLEALPDDMVYDPATKAWTALPPDPVRPSFDRYLHEIDGGVVLLAQDLQPRPGTEPPVTRAARLDPVTLTWSSLPDGEVVGSDGFWPVANQLVNVSAVTADGGQVNGWGRDYPYGGILDLETGWSALPGAAPVVPPRDLFGPVDGSGSGVAVAEGLALSPATGRWERVPIIAQDASGAEVDLPQTAAGSAVLASDDGPVVFVWGGVSWRDPGEGHLHDDGFIWRPST